MPVAMQAPIDTNRVVHFAVEGEHRPVGSLYMRSWIDPSVKNAKLGGIFNMGGTAVANYVSILERLR